MNLQHQLKWCQLQIIGRNTNSSFVIYNVHLLELCCTLFTFVNASLDFCLSHVSRWIYDVGTSIVTSTIKSIYIIIKSGITSQCWTIILISKGTITITTIPVVMRRYCSHFNFKQYFWSLTWPARLPIIVVYAAVWYVCNVEVQLIGDVEIKNDPNSSCTVILT